MVVAIAKENAYSQLYDELKGKEGRKKIYKLCIAKKRSDFMIDRKVTNEALKQERLLVAMNDDLSSEIQSLPV